MTSGVSGTNKLFKTRRHQLTENVIIDIAMKSTSFIPDRGAKNGRENLLGYQVPQS